MAKFNIFYSWQSDLPKTRNEIKSAITEAAQRFPNVAVVEATSNRTGSPDIWLRDVRRWNTKSNKENGI